MNKYLKKAIDLALENIKEGGTPYGAVVVLNDEIIGEGANTIHINPDISGHAELIAIKQAQKKLNRIDLSDCIVYASGHPCPMCLGAIAMSKIPKVIYANSLEEAASVGMGDSQTIYDYLKGNTNTLNLEIVHEPIMDDTKNPMIMYSKV